jgi:hypothetical protein
LPAFVFATASLWIFHRIARDFTRLLLAVWPWQCLRSFRTCIATAWKLALFARAVLCTPGIRCWTRADRDPSARTPLLRTCGRRCLYSHVFSVFPGRCSRADHVAKFRSAVPVLVAAAAAVAAYVLVPRSESYASRGLSAYVHAGLEDPSPHMACSASFRGRVLRVHPLLILAAAGSQ